MADLSTGKVYFDSSQNYQTIVQEGSQDVTIVPTTGQTLTTINHNLGYYPHVRVWFLNGSQNMCEPLNETTDDAFSFNFPEFDGFRCYFYVSTTQLKVYIERGVTTGTTNSTIYYRIYSDES